MPLISTPPWEFGVVASLIRITFFGLPFAALAWSWRATEHASRVSGMHGWAVVLRLSPILNLLLAVLWLGVIPWLIGMTRLLIMATA